MVYNIREAHVNDGAALARLRWEFRVDDGGEVPAVTREEFETAYLTYFRAGLATKCRGHIVADVEGMIVGQITVQTVDMVPRPCKVHDQWGYLTDTYVRPAYRGCGVGSALLDAAVEWARGRDLELLIVWPSDGAVGLYGRAGFVPAADVLQLQLRDYYDPSWSERAD